jgi:hypothetical protein
VYVPPVGIAFIAEYTADEVGNALAPELNVVSIDVIGYVLFILIPSLPTLSY